MSRNMKQSKYRHSSYHGYTLIELMVVLAIAAIMLAAGTPGIRDVLNRNAEAGAINNLVAGISAGRTYAVTHKRFTVIEPVDGDWTNGFFIKPGSVNEEPISEIAFPESGIVISSDSPFPILTFDPLGRVIPANSTFTLCNEDINLAVEINLNIFGKATVSRTAEGNLNRVAC